MMTADKPLTANRNWMFWLALFILFCYGLYILRSVLLPFVAGIIIGYLLDPWVRKINKWGMNRTLATFLVLLALVLIIVPSIILLLGVINDQITRFISVVPEYLASLTQKLEPWINDLQKNIPAFSFGFSIKFFSFNYFSIYATINCNIFKYGSISRVSTDYFSITNHTSIIIKQSMFIKSDELLDCRIIVFIVINLFFERSGILTNIYTIIFHIYFMKNPRNICEKYEI